MLSWYELKRGKLEGPGINRMIDRARSGDRLDVVHGRSVDWLGKMAVQKMVTRSQDEVFL